MRTLLDLLFRSYSTEQVTVLYHGFGDIFLNTTNLSLSRVSSFNRTPLGFGLVIWRTGLQASTCQSLKTTAHDVVKFCEIKIL